MYYSLETNVASTPLLPVCHIAPRRVSTLRRLLESQKIIFGPMGRPRSPAGHQKAVQASGWLRCPNLSWRICLQSPFLLVYLLLLLLLLSISQFSCRDRHLLPQLLPLFHLTLSLCHVLLYSLLRLCLLRLLDRRLFSRLHSVPALRAFSLLPLRP